MTNDESEQIAVVAVHGVADQKPGETARAVERLLRLSNSTEFRYSDVKTTEVVLPLDKVQTAPVPADLPEFKHSRWDYRRYKKDSLPYRVLSVLLGWLVKIIAQRAGSINRCLRKKRAIDDREYTRDQLADYNPRGAVYDSQCRSLTRESTSAENRRTQIDIYELYWADLSRVGSSFVRILTELYELLFFVCRLGHDTLDITRTHHGSNRWRRLVWKTFVSFHGIAHGFLLFCIPVLTLLMLGLVPLFALHRLHTSELQLILAVVWWIVWSLTFVVISRLYSRREPAVMRIAGLAVIAGLLLFGMEIHRGPTVCDTALHLTEWLVIAFAITWQSFYLFSLLACVLGWVACWRIDQPESPRTRRAFWTSLLALALPGMVILILNLSLFAGFTYTVEKLSPLPERQHQPLAAFRMAHDWLPGVLDETKQRGSHVERTIFSESLASKDVLSELLAFSTNPWFTVKAILLLILTVRTAMALWPMVQAEGKLASVEKGQTVLLGKQLSQAFPTLRPWADVCLIFPVVASTLLGPLFMIAFGWLRQTADNTPDPSVATTLLDIFEGPGLLTVIGVLILLVLTFSKTNSVLRSILDVALDVANWLRVHPIDNTPKAQICARYAALLQHLCSHLPRYRAIVIFSHSWGTVITADVLRFLNSEYAQISDDSPLQAFRNSPERRIPIYLFTMGCPLRQLNSLRLPHLYGWARHDQSEFLETNNPDPAELLGVKLWVNAYCSGDFVGRHLWHGDGGEGPWVPTTVPPSRTPAASGRREFCVGAGAHTYYWSIPQIGRELNQLIDFARVADTS